MELRSLGLPQHSSDLNLKELQQVTVELTTPEGHVYKVGRLSNEERAQKILKYAMDCKLAGRLISFMCGQALNACPQEILCCRVVQCEMWQSASISLHQSGLHVTTLHKC